MDKRYQDLSVENVKWNTSELRTRTIYKDSLTCFVCQGNGEYLQAESIVPYFGTVSMMTVSCLSCGYRSRRVTSNPTEQQYYVPNLVKRIKLVVKSSVDLERVVVRSEYCILRIPEIDFESCSCEGLFTTLEGLIESTYSVFASSVMCHSNETVNFEACLKQQIEELLNGLTIGKYFTIVLEDSSQSSFVGSLDKDDPSLTTISIPIDSSTDSLEESDFQKDLRKGVYKVVLKPSDIQTGQRYTCLYGGAWVLNCVIVRKLPKQNIFWVCEEIDYSGTNSNNCWMVTLSEMKTMAGLSIKEENGRVEKPGTISAKEGLCYLEAWARHLELEEGTRIEGKQDYHYQEFDDPE